MFFKTKQNLREYVYGVIIPPLNILEPLMGRYFTFHARPMRADRVLVYPEDVSQNYSDYAIVMQGPIILKNNFTLETLSLYKKYFPNALILLSTWEGENNNAINQIKKLGIEVILNKKPVNSGPVHINFQITSAKAGIKQAIEKNKKYVLKTRTDERIYNYNALSFLSNLVEHFPMAPAGIRQKGRIVSISSSRRKLYYFADMLIFGYTEDVLLYFSADLTPNNAILALGNERIPFTAEQYLFTEFLKKIGYQFQFTIEDSLRAQAKHCLVADASSLDWYWIKYWRFLEYRILRYRQKNYILGFSEWLNLYNQYRLRD